ncbi:MAG: hypothetical protein ACFFDI_11770 [Promethearchaeota archaeon]
MVRKRLRDISEIARNINIREYKGYTGNNHQRKKTDEAVRHFLAEQLRECEDNLRHIQENAILVQCIIVWPDLDELLRRLEKLKLLVERTDYDTSTFFLSDKIDPKFDMDALLQAEAIIGEHMNTLNEKIDNLGEEIDAGLYSDSSETVQEIKSVVDLVKSSYTHRVNLIKSYQQMF